jgi:hypothetical protein
MRLPPLAIALALVLGACGGTGGQETTTSLATTSATTPTTSTSTQTTTTTTTATMTTSEGGAALAELDEVVAAASNSDCAAQNRTRELISAVEGDPLFEQTGVIYTLSTGDETPFSVAEHPLNRIHFLLYLNLRRALFALHAFIEVPPERVDFYGHYGLVPFTEDDIIGSWSGERLEFVGDDPTDLTAFAFLRTPPIELRLSEEALDLAWMQAEDWLELVDESLPPASVESALPLEDLVVDLDRQIALLCAILATEYRVTEAALMAADADQAWLLDNVDIFFDELAVQNLLLMTEVIQVIDDRMSDPSIDWFRADGVDRSEAIDGTTSTTEYVAWWHISLDIARNEFGGLRP